MVGGRLYKYEVENVRGPDGSVRQRVIRYLGAETPVYRTAALRKGAKRKAGASTKRGTRAVATRSA